MQQSPTVRARLVRVSLSLLIGLAAVALPLWAFGPGASHLGGGSTPDRADRHGADNASMVSLGVPATSAHGKDGLQLSSASGHPGKVVVARLRAGQTADYTMVGVTWVAGTATPDLEVEVRTLTAGTWSTWQPLDIDRDGPSAPAVGRPDSAEATQVRAGTAPTWVGKADGIAVRMIASPGPAPEDVQVALIDGGTGLNPATDADSTAAQLSAATTGVPPRPTIVTRKQWGVDASTEVACDTPNTVPTMRGIVLHHTVNSNDYTAAEAPGIVRAIHLYHTKSRGWCDIGYNFLVDKYGVIYQGRRGGIDKQVRGAHAGNWDVNTYTTGISMIGNFDTATPPGAMKDAIVSFMAWRLASFGVDPMSTASFGGNRIPAISGHRDVYNSGIRPATATACPGRYAYDQLGGIRTAVQRAIAEAPPASASPTPTPTPSVPPSPTPTPEPSVSRVAADDRYATAAAIAEETFTAPVPAVFLTSGEDFPDALSGGPAAGSRGPILLTRGDTLPPDTVTALQRLRPETVYVLGGESAVPASVATQAGAYAGTVTRLAGANRYGTGKLIAKALWPNGAPTVYLASGLSFPDALSGGVLAVRDGAPILLSAPGRLPTPAANALTKLGATRVVLLGGTAALSDAVAAEVSQLLPSAAVSRIAGADRFATSAMIARTGWSEAPLGYFAAGGNFPDALAGVPAAAVNGAPLLLARPKCLPPSVYGEAQSLGLQERILLGGTSALRDGAATTPCAG